MDMHGLERMSKNGVNISEEWRLSPKITAEAFEYMKYDNSLVKIA